MTKTASRRLSAFEREIALAGRENPAAFTNWFIRGPESGSYYRPHQKRPFWYEPYDKLAAAWHELGRPDYFAFDGGDWRRVTKKQYEDIAEYVGEVYATRMISGSEPTFFRPHGFIPLDWQLEMLNAPQKTITILGGFASAKTQGALVKMLILGAILPGFKCFVIAPRRRQVGEILAKAKDLLRKTIYSDLFVVRWTERYMGTENQALILGSELTGTNNVIEFIPALDDPSKLHNLEGDAALVDQTEQFTNLLSGTDGLLPSLSSRLRGIDPGSGREREALTMFIANANDNPELWQLVARAQIDPDNYAFFNPSTFDNYYVSDAQLEKMIRDYGTSDEEINVHFKGLRPTGSGEVFSRALQELSHDPEIDQMMEANKNRTPGWVYYETPGVGLTRWQMPPIQDHHYLVAADPGWGNPPNRNSPVVGVFDITNFPRWPARMVAFHWVEGKGNPGSWIDAFVEYVSLYNATGRCAYDATGNQRGYSILVDRLKATAAEEVSLSGTKDSYLNVLRMIMEQGWLKMPYIPGMRFQMTQYVLPEPAKLPQDIVMMLVIFASWFANRPYLLIPPRNEPAVPYGSRPYDIRVRHSRNSSMKGRRRSQ